MRRGKLRIRSFARNESHRGEGGTRENQQRRAMGRAVRFIRAQGLLPIFFGSHGNDAFGSGGGRKGSFCCKKSRLIFATSSATFHEWVSFIARESNLLFITLQ